MWMVRFKEFAGFVLMAPVVWLLMAVSPQTVIPALVIFIGIALGLWMIGNLYDHGTPRGRKYAVRVAALILAGGICAFGYQMQYQRHHLPWQPFSTARVEELRASGKPILIDFTADWCLICKTNERIALNRPATARFVEEHGIVPLFADFTKESPEIRRWLELSNQEGVPLTLIFPKGRPEEAIALRGLYTQGTLLAKLKEAVADGTAAPSLAGRGALGPSGASTVAR
jgi:thiol:disulfide interchange protein DsbD